MWMCVKSKRIESNNKGTVYCADERSKFRTLSGWSAAQQINGPDNQCTENTSAQRMIINNCLIVNLRMC